MDIVYNLCSFCGSQALGALGHCACIDIILVSLQPHIGHSHVHIPFLSTACALELIINFYYLHMIANVTGFAKTVPNGTRIEIPFTAWHES